MNYTIMALMRQLGSGQDYAVKGTVGDVDYIAVMDGHGTGRNANKCIDLLRSYNFEEIATSENPVDCIQRKLEPHSLLGSGSTFTFARIYKSNKEIQVFNVGDSKTIVIINGKKVYATPEHTFHNPSELQRLQGKVVVRQTMAPLPINEKTVQMIRSDTGIFPNGERLVPSQSFGHDNITGLEPSIERIHYKEEDIVRIICGSDGFWDMYMENYEFLNTSTPDALIQIAEERWGQQWEYYDGKKPMVTTNYGNQFDDIAIAVWESF
jgi:serine/threonine protein phosphatase PrpC